MAVRAVTPRVVAISGHVAFYRDADHFDAAQDERATGEDIFDPEWPDKPLRLSPQRESHARPAHCRLRTFAMNASAPTQTGRDGRAAEATSSQPSARGTRADQSSAELGGRPLDCPGPRPRPEPSPPRARAGAHPNDLMPGPSGRSDRA